VRYATASSLCIVMQVCSVSVSSLAVRKKPSMTLDILLIESLVY